MKYWTMAPGHTPIPHLGGTAALADASEDELRILLCLWEAGRVPDRQTGTLARAAGCSPARAKAALRYWAECGVLTCAEEEATEGEAAPSVGAPKEEEDAAKGAGTAPVPEAPVTHDAPHPRPLRREARVTPRAAGESAATIAEKPGRRTFIETCEQTVGRVFNTAELGLLTGMLEELPFSEEYLLTLIFYCKKKLKRFSLHYVEKMAFTMLERECLTLEELNSYLSALDRFQSEEWALRRMFGMGERSFSQKEKAYLLRWTGEWGYGREIIGIAYDIAVDRTGKLSLPYMDKLLGAFSAAGCRTVEEVEAYLAREAAEHAAAHPAPAGGKRPGKRSKEFATGAGPQDPTATQGSSFDLDDFMSAALERSYGDDGKK